MTTQFEHHTTASVQSEQVDGQEVERRLDFELGGLDYSFVFSPPSDDPQEGATLTYVGNIERGRLPPSKYADDRVWHVASRMCY